MKARLVLLTLLFALTAAISVSAYCGDGFCEYGEGIYSCPYDCGGATYCSPMNCNDQCYQGNVHYGVCYGDSCGLGGMKQDCQGNGCSNGVCNPTPTPPPPSCGSYAWFDNTCISGHYYDLYKDSCGNQYQNPSPAHDYLCAPAPTCSVQDFCQGDSLYRKNADCSSSFVQNCQFGCANGACKQQTCSVQDFCSGSALYRKNLDCSSSLIQNCPYGCANGACKQQTCSVQLFCSDSMTVSRRNADCSTSFVQSCPYGCANGACKQQTCSVQDFCSNGDLYHRNADCSESFIQDCQNGCSNGQCQQPPQQFCGDHACNNGESCSSCPGDCGACPIAQCPYQSTQAFIKSADGTYTNFKTVTRGASLQLFAFHDHNTNAPATDAIISLSGPTGSFQVSNGAFFTFSQPGSYAISVSTIGYSQQQCKAQATVKVEQRECVPGSAPQTLPCGIMCGTKTRSCDASGHYQDSACTTQGVCVPGASQSCDLGGHQSCSASCQWSACQEVGVCFPGTVQAQACGDRCGLKYRTCGSDFQWNAFGPCTAEGVCKPGQQDQQLCGIEGVKVRSCTNVCEWSSFGACQEPQRECRPGEVDTSSCGNCGQHSRVCLSDGTWSSFNTCSGQGVCAPGSTQSQSCGIAGTQTRVCSSSCQFGSFGSCQDTAACQPGTVKSTSCGLCGTRTDVCNAQGQFVNGSCLNQGICAPGSSSTLACGYNGTKTQVCTSSCQFGEFSGCSDGSDNAKCMPGQVQAEVCGSSGLGVCGKGTATRVCGADFTYGAWSACSGNIEPSLERCNGKDDDCDGKTDEGVTCTYLMLKSVQVLNEECVNPGQEVMVRVALDNQGKTDFEDQKVTVSSDLLDVYAQSDLFDVDDGDQETIIVRAMVPAGAPAGDYDLRVVVGDEVTQRRVVYRPFTVSAQVCGSCAACQSVTTV